MRERRRSTRAHPGDGDLGVAVRTATGTLHRGQVVMVSSENVRIGFPVNDPPEPQEGSPVKLLFRTLAGGDLTASGRLTGEGGLRDAHRLYDLIFDSTPTSPPSEAPVEADDAPATDRESRRAAYRVRPDHGSLQVRMRPLGDPGRSVLRQLMELRVRGPAMTVTGWADDLSGDGIGVVVEAPDVHVFEADDLVDLTLSLPGGGPALTLAARIRHRRVLRPGIRYGLSFDRFSTEHFRTVQQRVLELVVRLQQRKLGPRAG